MAPGLGLLGLRSRRVLHALLLLTLAACSTSAPEAPFDAGPPGPPCDAGVVGDGGAPAIQLQALQADGTVTPLVEGSSLPLVFPIQGGFVSFVGVRATNVDACGATITGALRDLATQEVRLDSRTVNLEPVGGGWSTTGVSGSATSANFANIPLCPNEWSSTNVYGNLYGLEVTLQDARGRKVTQKIHVTPQCAEASMLDNCLCNCQKGYVLGQACSAAASGDP